jgi:hypothetical protein
LLIYLEMTTLLGVHTLLGDLPTIFYFAYTLMDAHAAITL